MINYSILEEYICKYLDLKYDIKVSVDNLDMRLIDFGLDSLDMVELIINLEEKYGIVITPSEFDETESFRKLIDLIYNKIVSGKRKRKSCK